MVAISPRPARPLLAGLLLWAMWVLFAGPGHVLANEPPFITLASTTSTDNSGLFAWILPRFTADTGIAVRVVARGTGAALRLGRQGDVDALLVHHRESEDAFVREGHGSLRYDVMYNDFVLVGPAEDPAGVTGSKSGKDVTLALAAIAAAGAPFVSRGDDSGTHKKEVELWRAAGVDARAQSGAWYREAGSGMGATLNLAAGMGAYTLSDRATWLAFKNRRGLRILSQGDPRLFNPYGVLVVNPARFPHVKAREARIFADWLISSRGQQAIAGFTLEGQQVFFPNAGH